MMMRGPFVVGSGGNKRALTDPCGPYGGVGGGGAVAAAPVLRQPLPPARVPQLLGRGVTRLKEIVKAMRKV